MVRPDRRVGQQLQRVQHRRCNGILDLLLAAMSGEPQNTTLRAPLPLPPTREELFPPSYSLDPQTLWLPESNILNQPRTIRKRFRAKGDDDNSMPC